MSTAIVTEQSYGLRVAAPGDTAAIEALWRISQDVDDRAFWPPNGWWSLATWALDMRLLLRDLTPIGAAALAIAPARAAEVRLALTPTERTAEAADRLLLAAINWAQVNHLPQVRLAAPTAARWATSRAARLGFHRERAFQIMLRSALAAPVPLSVPSGLRIRPMRAGEERLVLDALNRAWVGTWNFQPLTLEAFLTDLHGQPEDVLLAVDAADERSIAGTVHARFDPESYNPGGAPFAWISNLTTLPAWRGRGLGRALLAAGIARLHAQGARSVALGVDTGNPVPFALYQSAGFVAIDSLEFWEYELP